MTSASGDLRNSRPRLLLLDSLLLCTLALVVLGVELRARSARSYAASPRVVRCGRPEGALPIWREHGVKGRVLFHFARSVAMEAEPGPASARNYLLRAIDEGIVRSVYHVIPDDAWPEVASRLDRDPRAVRRGERFHLRSAGTPVVVLRRDDLATLREPALVTIEGDRWSRVALAAIAVKLRSGLPADLVTWYGDAPETAELLGGLAP